MTGITTTVHDPDHPENITQLLEKPLFNSVSCSGIDPMLALHMSMIEVRLRAAVPSLMNDPNSLVIREELARR